VNGLKEIGDLILPSQRANRALTAAWESWRYGEEGHYAEQFSQRFAEAEFQELIDVLGVDPRSITREQWTEIQSLANFIWNDDET
jgi:NADH:ubiquinone oxidoreductase subunit C